MFVALGGGLFNKYSKTGKAECKDHDRYKRSFRLECRIFLVNKLPSDENIIVRGF